MPQKAGREFSPLVLGFLICVNDMDVLQARTARNRCSGMFVKLPKVLSQLALGIDVKVCLVTEENNTSNGDEPS